MGRTWVSWSNEEKDDLATRIILALSEGNTVSTGIKSFLAEFSHQNRTEGTCHWMWTKELKETYNDEIERLGIKLVRRSKSSSKGKPSEQIPQTTISPDVSLAQIYQEINESTMSRFFETFEQLVKQMKSIYNAYIHLRNENEALRGQLSIRDEALEKATDELQTFIKAFQIARPSVISGASVSTTVNNKGEVEKIEITG